MLKVGLTGGMGSGKSTVAARLRELGAVVIDADSIARGIVEPGQPALAELVDEFGEDIINADGTLNRGALASKAFANAEATAALNAITHPRIAERTAQYYREAEQAHPSSIVVYDMPLLLEIGLEKDQDVVMVVHAPVEKRLDRLEQRRGVDRADAQRRIQSQISDAERLQRADIVLDNSGDVQSLLEDVDRQWQKLTRMAI